MNRADIVGTIERFPSDKVITLVLFQHLSPAIQTLINEAEGDKKRLMFADDALQRIADTPLNGTAVSHLHRAEDIATEALAIIRAEGKGT